MQTRTQPNYDLLTQFKYGRAYLHMHSHSIRKFVCLVHFHSKTWQEKEESSTKKRNTKEEAVNVFYWNLTGVREKAREKKQDRACALLMGHIYTLAVNRAEATLFSALNHLVTAKHSHQPDDDTLPLHF